MNRNFKEFYMDYKRSIEEAYTKLFYTYIYIDNVRVVFRKSDFKYLNDVLNTERMEHNETEFSKYCFVRQYVKYLNDSRKFGKADTLFLKDSFGNYYFNMTDIENKLAYNLKESKRQLVVYNSYETN